MQILRKIQKFVLTNCHVHMTKPETSNKRSNFKSKVDVSTKLKIYENG